MKFVDEAYIDISAGDGGNVYVGFVNEFHEVSSVQNSGLSG